MSVQTLLAAIGYDPGPPDGFMGPRTTAAILSFQQRNGDPTDGRPTDALRGRLQAALVARYPSGVPTSPRRVGVSSGTGFFVAPTVVVTNHHVIENCSALRLKRRGVEIGGARVIGSHREDDLAALGAVEANEHILTLRIGRPVKPGEQIVVFGFPLSSALSSHGNTTIGHVTAVTGLKDDSRSIQISAPVQPGSSGGPVLDSSGRLIGVVRGKLDAIRTAHATGDLPQNVNFAIRGAVLATFLDIQQIGYSVSAGSDTDIPITTIAESAERASVQVECLK